MPRVNNTRMPGGVTNAAPYQTLADYGAPDPSFAYENFHDFNRYAAADWTETIVGTGGVTATAAAGGAVTLTTSAGATDAVYMQEVIASHKLVAGKDHFFKWKGNLPEVLNEAFYCGLIATSATPLTANDGLYFYKASGQAALALVSKIGGVATTLALPAVATLVAGAEFEVGFHVTAGGDVEAFFNPTTGLNVPATDGSAGVGYIGKMAQPGLTQVLLNPSMGLLNSTALAHSVVCDYIFAASHR